MNLRGHLMAMAIAPMVIGFVVKPSEAAAFVVVNSFSQACAPGSGFTEVSGGIWEFKDYLSSAPDGSCYLGNLKFSQFGDLSGLGIAEANLYISNQPHSDFREFSIARIAPLSPAGGSLSDLSFDYVVSGWSGGNLPFATLRQWSALVNGYGNFSLTTTASPPLDPACSPSVVTSSSSPTGPDCTASAGVVVEEMAITNTLVGRMGSDSLDAAAFSNDFVVVNTLPPPGTDPSNPFLPPTPQAIDQPWLFPPVDVTDPGQVWWYDPEVSIGYIYQVTDPAGPLFDQYIAPDLPFNDTYELLSSGGNACSGNPADYTTSLATITQNVAYDFSSPLACFAIKGISEQNALDPLNTTAFVAGISFDRTGTVSVTQTPIPTPGPLPLAGAGVAYSWTRGLRRRLNQRDAG